MSGVGASAQSQADSYKYAKKNKNKQKKGTGSRTEVVLNLWFLDEWVFGMRDMWVLAPERYGAHNWYPIYLI